MVGCMLVMAGSSFTIRLNLRFYYNTVNSNALGVVIALVNSACLGLILWSSGSVVFEEYSFVISKPPLYMKNKGTETPTNTCIVHKFYWHAGSRGISNFSLAKLV